MNRLKRLGVVWICVTMIVVLLNVSCTRESFKQNSYLVSVGTKIGESSATKVTVDDENQIHWSKGDKLKMLAIAENDVFAFAELSLNQVDAGLKNGKFYGDITIDSEPHICYFAHPATTAFRLENANVLLDFSYERQAGTHAPYLHSEAIAYSASGINCTLHHLGGMLRIMLPVDVMSSISVQGNNGEKITSFIHNAATGTTEVASGAVASFTVQVPTGVGECYIAMPPVNFTKGFSLVFTGVSGGVMYKSFNAAAGYDFSQNKGVLIPITVSDFIPFELSLGAEATHFFNKDGNLSGSKVKISFVNLHGAPSKTLTGWGAELYNNADIMVRSIQSQSKLGEITVQNSLLMNDVTGWPYLPQGLYSLKSYVILNGVKVYGVAQNIVVPAPPQLTITASATSSYNNYLDGNITDANNCDGSTIYGITSTVNIVPEIVSNVNYVKPETSYVLDGNASVSASMSSSSHDFGAVGEQSWTTHAVAATVSFDGVTFTSKAQTVQVTGLPYRFDFYDNEKNIALAGWTSSNVLYASKKCTIQSDGSNGYLISPRFNGDAKVNYMIEAQYYRAWAVSPGSKSIDLYIGTTSSTSAVADIYNTHNCPGNNDTGKWSKAYSATLNLVGEKSHISIYHNKANIAAQVDNLCIYNFAVFYAE